MTEAPQTYSASHLRRQREAHTRTDGYGRHRHLYLHDTIRRIAEQLRRITERQELTWLDYGCGKGTFIEEIRPLDLFGRIAGYDPAVDKFRTRPERSYDLVTCLDVLDVTESRFVPNLAADVARLTDGVALFDCLTRPKPDGALRPHPPFHWNYIVGQAMRVLDTRVEFAGLDGFERVLVLAAPRDSAIRLDLYPGPEAAP